MVTCGGIMYSLGDCADAKKYVSNACKYGNGRKENWTLTGKISMTMDAAALITKGKAKLIYIVTRQLNEYLLYVQMVDYFDTQTGKVVYLTFCIEFNHKPLSFQQQNILSVHSQKKNLDINLQKKKFVEGNGKILADPSEVLDYSASHTVKLPSKVLLKIAINLESFRFVSEVLMGRYCDGAGIHTDQCLVCTGFNKSNCHLAVSQHSFTERGGPT
ncbi:LOW QUALITY PROTEIN: calicin [Leptosomus discolor]